jgi:hypothetical protein
MTMDNPARFNMDSYYIILIMEHPNMTWDEILRLHNRSVLCYPNGQRLGRWDFWKFGCDEGFKDAICRHSMLLALLFNQTLTFPQRRSYQLIKEPVGGPVLGVRSRTMTQRIRQLGSISS